jgi:hypothetical protein
VGSPGWPQALGLEWLSCLRLLSTGTIGMSAHHYTRDSIVPSGRIRGERAQMGYLEILHKSKGWLLQNVHLFQW